MKTAVSISTVQPWNPSLANAGLAVRWDSGPQTARKQPLRIRRAQPTAPSSDKTVGHAWLAQCEKSRRSQARLEGVGFFLLAVGALAALLIHLAAGSDFIASAQAFESMVARALGG